MSCRNSNFTRPVVQTGREYKVDITDIGRAGDGIARIQGFVIFVKNSRAGDKNIKIKRSRRMTDDNLSYGDAVATVRTYDTIQTKT